MANPYLTDEENEWLEQHPELLGEATRTLAPAAAAPNPVGMNPGGVKPHVSEAWIRRTQEGLEEAKPKPVDMVPMAPMPGRPLTEQEKFLADPTIVGNEPAEPKTKKLEINPYLRPGETFGGKVAPGTDSPDDDPNDYTNLFSSAYSALGEQTYYSLLRSGPATLASLADKAGDFLEGDKRGVILKKPDGSVVGAQVGPAGVDQWELWKEQKIAEAEQNPDLELEFVPGYLADRAVYALEKQQPEYAKKPLMEKAFEVIRQNLFTEGDSFLPDFTTLASAPLWGTAARLRSFLNDYDIENGENGETVPEAVRTFQSEMEETAALIGEDAKEAAKDYKNPISRFAGSVGASYGGVLPSIIAGGASIPFLGPNALQVATLGSMGFFSGVMRRQEMVEEGQDYMRTQQMEKIKTFTEPMTEAYSIGALFKDPTKLKGLVEYLAREVPSEILETTLDDLATWVVVDQEKPADVFLEEWWEHAVDTALITPFAGGLQRGTVTTVAKTAEVLEKGQEKVVEIAGKLMPGSEFVKHKMEAVDQELTIEMQQQIRADLQAQLDQLNEEAPDIDMYSELDSFEGPMGEIIQGEKSPLMHYVMHEDIAGQQNFAATSLLNKVDENLPVKDLNGNVVLLREVKNSKTTETGDVYTFGETPAEEALRLGVIKTEKGKKALEELAKKERKAVDHILQVVKAVQEKYIPEAHIIYSLGGLEAQGKMFQELHTPKHGAAYLAASPGGRGTGGTDTVFLAINPQAVTDFVAGRNDDIIAQTAHELGHLTAGKRVMDFMIENSGVRRHLDAAYIEQLKKAMSEKTLTEAARHLAQPWRGESMDTYGLGKDLKEGFQKGQKESVNSQGNLSSYLFGIDEFVAENMIKVLIKDEKVSPEFDKMAKEFGVTLKPLYEMLQQGPYKLNENYEQYIRGVLLGNDLARAETRIIRAQAAKIAAAREMVRTKPFFMTTKRLNSMLEDLLYDAPESVQQELLLEVPKGVKTEETTGTVNKSWSQGTTGATGATGTTTVPPASPTTPASPPPASPYGPPLTPKNYRKKVAKDMTKFSVITRWMAGLEQIFAMNQNVESLKIYRRHVLEYQITKSQWTADATDMLLKWRDHVGNNWLESQHSTNFNEAMVEIDQESDSLGRKLRLAELEPILQKHNLNQKDLDLMNEIWNLYGKALSEIESSLIDRIQRVYAESKDPLSYQKMTKEIGAIRQDFAKMRNKNYMPHTRFGKYRIKVKAAEATTYKGQKYKKGETITYMGADSLWEHKKILKTTLQEFANKEFEVLVDEINDDAMLTFQGIQPEAAFLIAKAIGMTPEQQSQLRDLMISSSPGQSIRKHMLERAGVPGYSRDAQRAFADYFARFSSHAARVRHAESMKGALSLANDEMKRMSAKNNGDRKMRKRAQLRDWMKRHYDYMMDPGEEWAQIRAAGFFWYLAFVPKSAVVNLTQVPFVTYPYLAARFGDANTAQEMTKSMGDVFNYFTGKMRGSNAPIDQDILSMWEELRRRQVVDEGMTTMLAGLANDRSLSRIKAKGVFSQGIRVFAQKGAYLFQTAEKMNRYYSSLAAYRLARRSGMNHAEATDFAADAVKGTQLEYARFNRPELMRGQKSVMFLFYQYLTQMMYFVGNDPGWWRYLGIMLVMGGYTAMPGAENFIDIADMVLTKFKTRMGMANPKTQIRVLVASFINDLTDEVSWLPQDLYALMEDGVMGNLWGYDIQGSVSMGNLLPFDTSIFSTEGDVKEKVARLAETGAGAPVGAALNILYALGTQEPYNWRTLEKTMPVFGQNMMKGPRRYLEQQDQSRPGARPVKFSDDDPYGKTAMIAEMMGFPKKSLKSEKEKRFWAADAARFYANQDSAIRTSFFDMMQRRMDGHPPDKKDWERFYERVDRYNNGVKELDPRLRISRGDLMDSWSNRRDAERTEEHFGHRQRKYQRVSSEVLEERR